MREKIKKIFSEQPSKVEVYVFGSILTSKKPNDLDIIIVYNSKEHPGSSIYKSCRNLLNTLHKTFKLDIDITVLSYSENEEIGFTEKVQAIRLDRFLYKLI